MDTDTPQSELEQTLSNDAYDQWVSQYRMREKVHCPPDLRDELNDPMVECRFEIYDGPVTDTRVHRRHDTYLTLMWGLCK